MLVMQTPGTGLGVSGSLYRLVLLLHIACAVVGLGALLFNGAYRARARGHDGDTELIMLTDNAHLSRWADGALWGVLVFGLLASLTSQNLWQASQSWLSASILLYLVELGLLYAVIRRAEGEYRGRLRRVNAGEGDEAADIARLESLEQLLRWAWLVFDAVFLVILYLMVFTPGHVRVG